MRSDEFREWLSRRTFNGKPLTRTANSSRLSWLRGVERALPEIGFNENSLDAVYASGRWTDLLTAMSALRSDWRSNEPAARKIAPQSENPAGQMANARAALGLYGHFAAGQDPNYDAATDDSVDRFAAAMDTMRETFLERMYDFDRMSHEDGVYWEVEKSYKYAARGEVLSFALGPEGSEEQRGKAMYERLCQSTVQGLPLSWRTKAEITKAPADLKSRFYLTIFRLYDPERPIADLAAEGAHALEALRNEGIEGLRRGEVLNIVLSVLGSLRPNDCCWFKISVFDKASQLLLGKRLFPNAQFVRSEFEEFQDLLFRIRAVLEEWEWDPETLEDVQGFLWVALAETWDVDWGPFPDPQAVDAVMAEYDELGSEKFGEAHPGFGTPTEYWVRGKGAHKSNIYPSKPIAALSMGWDEINGGWSKPDSGASLLHRAGYRIVDAQGRPVAVPNKPYLVSAGEALAEGGEMQSAAATNLILYGPPGTGKTYTSAAEAVRLCDGLDTHDPLLADSARRADLRLRYDELVESGQVRLVTFHQNYSYEEFVEGLRPVTDVGTETDEPSQGTGFRLEPKRGIFRDLCTVAENARKNTGGSGAFDLAGRRFFKMSLGRAGVEDYIFDAAIDEGYAVLGWGGDVDWSDDLYTEWAAILERWRKEDPKATGNDPNVVQMWPFRSAMNERDLIIVSSGNAHFRAIGEVTGPYRFEATETGTYNHRRAVRWILVPDEPLPAEMIYGKKFMMQSCYQLKDALVNKEALSRLLRGPDDQPNGRPDQYVLIIDEINRANISKVFGELITLLEPDKRLGSGPEALTTKLPYSGEIFGVPANLHIIGTMNTADRSIAQLDTALRRRFVFREMPPEPSLLPASVDGVPLRSVLESINDRIEYLVDREHRIGHAFFLADGGKDRPAIDRTMRDKVIPLLQEYFFDDWGRIAAVLGEPSGGGFLDCRKLKDPLGEGEDRASWSVRPSFAPDAYDRLIGKSQLAIAEAAE